MYFVSEDIEQYCKDFSGQDSELLKELSQATWEMEEIPQMLCGSLVGGLLQLLIKISGAERVLEIGMFTGYSTLKMAEALPDDGEIHSCELMENHVKTAKGWFEKSEVNYKIHIHEGDAIKTLEEFRVGTFDMIFVDADKTGYPEYYRKGNALLKKGGIAVFDNMLWSGTVLNPDDKESKSLRETAELIKNNHRLEPLLLPVRDGVMIYRKVN
ncbi:MAG: methyltransferase [Candidatus Neomarinimicrobiota bacterium]|jgi:caffeoyl-CoA O-methyltransferase|nr:MAG: methyltransferase [Candidatus Neomarinimicrobiota bacterium]HIB78826.1 methyltransferase domain-containing protein [Candidatus Neomarinimicrobiota bacterium]